MGGDHAPDAIVTGALKALTNSDLHLHLVGDRTQINKLLGGHSTHSHITIHHTSDYVCMTDEPLVTTKRLRHASINICMELLRLGRVQAVLSAGNSGATVSSAILRLRKVPGVHRPALLTRLQITSQNTLVMLDSGANYQATARDLVQFACMGYRYAKRVLDIDKPCVALLSNGQESYKGTKAIRSAHEKLTRLLPSYCGFTESSDLLHGKVDVVVCDGFVGNVLLKALEGFADLIIKSFSNLPYPLGKALDYSSLSGAFLAGVQGPVYVAHGNASQKDIVAAIQKICRETPLDLTQAMTHEVNKRFPPIFRKPGLKRLEDEDEHPLEH